MPKVIKIRNHTFDKVADPVKTEQNVAELMYKNSGRIPEDFGYVEFPIADYINKNGVEAAQWFLDTMEYNFPFQKVYVCQHIHAQNLNFRDNLVFTPHTLKGQRHIVIPHYNALIQKEDFIPVEKRHFMFSFIGAYNSHPIRKTLDRFNSPYTPVADTGAWHYYKSDAEKEQFKKSYIESLCQTKFNLCPEGTGVSTIRLYEAMACGSIPVLFNDVKVPDVVRRHCIYTTVDDLQSTLMRNLHGMEQRMQEIHRIYWEKLANEHMFEYILENVQLSRNQQSGS